MDSSCCPKKCHIFVSKYSRIATNVHSLNVVKSTFWDWSAENCAEIRHKENKPVVPVSYREKIRVGRSEIFFFEYFFHGFFNN